MKHSVDNGCLPILTLLLLSLASRALGLSNGVEIDYWQRSRCPQSCTVAGPNPSGWQYYHDENVFRICQETTLFQLNLYNPVVDPTTHLLYRACTASTSASNNAISTYSTRNRRQFLSFNTTSPTEIQVDVNLASWGTSTFSSDASSVSSAISQLSDYLQQNSAFSSSLFARSGNVVAGMYVGVEIDPSSAASVAQEFLNHASSRVLQREAAQICHTSNSTTEAQVVGIIYDTTGDLSAVQSALSSWDSASCITGSESNGLLEVMLINLISGTTISIEPGRITTRSELIERATCSYIQVLSGNTCSTLAMSCGITLAQFESYNGGASECSDLQIGQYVCCSAGSLPNFAPQPYANGTCYTYTVKSDDTCSAIAATYQMQVTVIENSNNQTWGWMGCTDLFIGMQICLSSGNPPYPANVPNAVCGPQVNNTVYPASSSKWAALNPCPINACCDIFGQCGITSDFCTPSQSATGAPGTAAPGSNGCISNCGTQVVASSPPSTFARMGYFEAFNNQRPCMNMAPSDIPSSYSHVHFAFANITSDYGVDISGLEDIFQQFLDTNGFARVLSFGGWAFSTDPSTFPIFRQGVTAANRLSFALNVANFVQSYDLQGVDFDWEYPGPSIIPGIPSGSPEDGANYQSFLQVLREALPSQYTISITAPASFYYLQNFPIYNMSQIVDYIVFMTYDLHGQWDYGNAFTDPGCPLGGCLRSQINMTETQSAFSMITKAGVPANMIMVGQPLYGRSFQMSEAGCYTEQCTFTGPNSGALPGPCTETPSYIGNWEIEQIISNSQYESSVEEYYSEVAGDILVYDSTQWISWMKPSTYNSRSLFAQGLNFGGTCDWAIDLNASYAPNGTPIGEGSGVVYVPPDIYSSASPTVTCLPPCTFVFPPWTLSTVTTITIPATTMTVQEIWPSVSTETNGVTTTLYVSSTTVTTITLPPITTNIISVWNVEWTNTLINTLYLTSSILPPVITLTESADKHSSTTLPGIIYTYAPGPFPPTPTTFPPVIHPPPGYTIGSIPVVIGPPGPTCLPGEIGCGGLCIIDCGPSIPCIGICGCIGPFCPEGGDCIGPGCSGGEDEGDGGDDDETTTCAKSTTVQDCEVGCSITNYGDVSFATNCFTTACSSVVGCETIGSTVTSETTTAACPLTPLAYPSWTPDGNAQLPFLGTDNSWTTPGAASTSIRSTTKSTSATSKPITTSKSITTSKPTTTAQSTTTSPAPSSASPSQILFFTDTKCKDFYLSSTISELYDSCHVLGSPINSYIIGTVDNCGCLDSEGYCSWDAFVITTSSGCGYDDEVGGGCNVPKCTQTTAPAQYNTAELFDNGVCKRDGVAANGTNPHVAFNGSSPLRVRC